MNNVVLFLNHKVKSCGVYQYGVRLFQIFSRSNQYNYVYEEIENYDEYCKMIQCHRPVCIFYNYHCMTMRWLSSETIQKNVKNIATQHDLEEYDFFDVVVRLDTTLQEFPPKKYNLPRPIYENVNDLLQFYSCSSESFRNFVEYKEEGVPVFGSFGFARSGKGFDRIIRIINERFDHAIIKFLIPSAHFLNENLVHEIVHECLSIVRKPGIQLKITSEFVDNKDILYFLKSNTMNLFMYDDSFPNSGVSSVIDYALSVKKPMAISKSHWFRHVYNDKICVEITDIDEILETSMHYVEKLCEHFSNKNLIDKMDVVISKNIQPV
jgi:hypothetical protein